MESHVILQYVEEIAHVEIPAGCLRTVQDHNMKLLIYIDIYLITLHGAVIDISSRFNHLQCVCMYD